LWWAGWLVGLVGAEHGHDDVAAAAGQADQGGVVAFAFGAFAQYRTICPPVLIAGDQRTKWFWAPSQFAAWEAARPGEGWRLGLSGSAARSTVPADATAARH
jgi:hypothetical protein